MSTNPSGGKPTSVIVLGIDGATWRLMDPLMQQGMLPNIANLINGGVRATSRSLDVLATPLVWTSIATGKVPRKHGITHFFDTTADLKTKRIWDIISHYYPDTKTGLFGWPVTWPPVPLNGFVVPSFLARSPAVYPESLGYIKQLEFGARQRRKVGMRSKLSYLCKAVQNGLRWPTFFRIAGYLVQQPMLPVSARFYKQHFLAPFLYADQYRHLLRFYRPFFTAFYIQAVDACSHMYWKYLFPDEFADVDTKEVSRYHDVIPRAYEVADQVIGNILSDFGESTLIVVASDHGFQGFGGDPRRIRYRLRTERLLKLLGLEEIVTYVNRGEVFTTLRVKKAHTEREPEVVKLLSEVHVPQLDKPLFLIDRNNLGDIILRQNIYVDAPESLVVQVPGQKCTFADLFVINSFRKSGIHAHDGILVMRGPGVRQNIVLPECSVLDVTPTILGLLGLPIGRDMDGKVLEAAIEPSWLELHPLRFIDSHDGDFVPVDAELDEELSAVLRDRLRALGYID
jgi:hypothetical protein